MALLVPGDSACGSGIAKTVYEQIKNDPNNGFATGLEDDRFNPLRALVWGHVKGIVDAINTGGGVGGGGGGALIWTALYTGGDPLDNGWKCYMPISVAKDAQGTVYLIGSVDATGGVPSGIPHGVSAGGSASVFTLPAGYRPSPARYEYSSACWLNDASNSVVSAFVRINPDGTVRVALPNGTSYTPKSLGLWCSFYAGP